MGGAMLGNHLLTWYLFLGGAGAGLYIIAYVVVFLNCMKPQPLSRVVLGKVWPRALTMAVFALVAGSVCLLKDLSRSGQAFYLFVKPSFSTISIGAYALAALIVCIVILIALVLRRHDVARFRLLLVIGGIAAVLSAVVILYTAFLLQSIAAVPFWRSPVVVPLFAASSLSSGVGCFALASASVFGKRTLCLKEYAVALNLDTLVLAIEALLIAAYAFHLSSLYGPSVFASFLQGGSCYEAFWVGVVAIGIAAPLVLYRIPVRRIDERYCLFIAAACCSIAGAFFLRYCFIFGAVHISSIILLGV